MILKVGYKLPTKSEGITAENVGSDNCIIEVKYETEDKFKSPAAWVKKLFCGCTLDDLPHSLRHSVCDSGGGKVVCEAAADHMPDHKLREVLLSVKSFFLF